MSSGGQSCSVMFYYAEGSTGEQIEVVSTATLGSVRQTIRSRAEHMLQNEWDIQPDSIHLDQGSILISTGECF